MDDTIDKSSPEEKRAEWLRRAKELYVKERDPNIWQDLTYADFKE